jgi:transposase-like protein
MSEESETRRDTTPKKDVIWQWLDENHEPGMTVHAVAKAIGCGFDTAKRWMTAWEEMHATGEETNVADEGAEVDADDEGVVVSRAYLLTLEALRDQVLETQRLRRMLEAQ